VRLVVCAVPLVGMARASPSSMRASVRSGCDQQVRRQMTSPLSGMRLREAGAGPV